MRLTLDNRLSAVMNEIEEDDRIADIGTDHGKIAVLATQKTGKKVIAADISAPSLLKAERLAQRIGVDALIDFRCGDGLTVVKEDEVDTAVIAGMGGMEIIKILTCCSFRLKKYILVPHSDAVALRIYLLDNGYGLYHDYIVEESGKFYRIFAVGNNGHNYTEAQRIWGLEGGETFERYRNFITNKYLQIIETASDSKKSELIQKLKLLEEIR